MATILLRIFFQGLIAFVPAADGSNHMTALLVDARTPSAVASGCVAAHTPEIRFRTTTAQCLAGAALGCHVDQSDCVCTPVRQEISLATAVTPAKVTIHRKPTAPMPSSPAVETGEFSYLANVLNLPAAAFNNDFLTLKPAALLDRMTFAYDSATPCMLAARNVPAGSEVHTFSFGRVGDPSGNAMSQAIAAMMVAHATVPYDGVATKVTLNVVGLDQTTSISLDLFPQPCDPHAVASPLCIDLRLTNDRPELDAQHAACDDGRGRDFAFFGELFANPPLWEARLIPIDDNTTKVNSTSLEVGECADHDKGPMNRPICAMASVIP